MVPGMTTRASKKADPRDGLRSALTGAGTDIDRAVHLHYRLQLTDPVQLESSYRSSWLARKIVNIPAEDMTAQWRQWQAPADDITALEAAEKRFQVQHKVLRALILGRLFGGAAIIMGLRDGTPDQPLPGVIKPGDLVYLHVVNRHQLGHTELETSVMSARFGEPKAYTLAGATIHPDRVIPFQGVATPEGSVIGGTSNFWGDSVLQAAMDAVKNADLTQAGFADLVNEAKIDIIKIPDLMQQIVSAEYERALTKRLTIAATAKSIHRALIIGGGEEWQQRQITWTGMPDMIRSYLELVAGAADIPLTRLLGTSPGGLQSTGKGEERNYLQSLESARAGELSRALDRLDAVLIPSTLETVPDGLHYTWPSLIQQDAKADAETEKLHSDALANAVNAGLVPADVAAEMLKGRIIERGHWPGAEMAYEAAATTGTAIPGDPGAARARDSITDAAPRTLYVSRPVLNRADLQAWATEQGLGELQPDLHVTIAYSRTPVDWFSLGNASEFGNADGKLIVPEGGPRAVEPLGDKTAVLLFSSWELSWRHGSIREKGASWDFPEYQPHISLNSGPAELDRVKPYTGKIVLGAERFSEIPDSFT